MSAREVRIGGLALLAGLALGVGLGAGTMVTKGAGRPAPATHRPPDEAVLVGEVTVWASAALARPTVWLDGSRGVDRLAYGYPTRQQADEAILLATKHLADHQHALSQGGEE